MARYGILDDAAVEAAYKWLNESSEEIALARAEHLRKEYKAKRVHARLVKHGTGAMDLRKAVATDHEEYAAAMEDYFEASRVWDLMQDQRERAKAICEAWRTAEASGRMAAGGRNR
jgi:predicted ribonuclease toxin of YeeF-YezG toxin-antitoxin module